MDIMHKNKLLFLLIKYHNVLELFIFHLALKKLNHSYRVLFSYSHKHGLCKAE